MVTKWSKVAVLSMSLLLIFTFTLTTNVVFEVAPVWAEESEEGTDEVATTTEETSGGFFSGIINWVNSVTNAINKMWGMENGNGVAMVINGAFYLLLIVGALFIGKMIFNIINDTLNRGVDEKYEKPSFRKK